MQTRLRLKTDSGSHWLTDLSAHSGWTHGCCGRAVGAAGSTLQGVTQGPFEVTIITSHWHRSAGYPKHLDIFSWKLAQPIEQHLTLKPAAYFKYVTGRRNCFFSGWNVNISSSGSAYGTAIQGRQGWMERAPHKLPVWDAGENIMMAFTSVVDGGKLPLDHFQLTSSDH